jgi:hypothetical protein
MMMKKKEVVDYSTGLSSCAMTIRLGGCRLICFLYLKFENVKHLKVTLTFILISNLAFFQNPKKGGFKS